jgi:catechol 2,3-dioxygenase-like lactoylglutathione lyase family enzyme
MSGDRFDHLFVQPSSFDASVAFYRDALGWKVAFAYGGKGEPRLACLSSEAVSVVLAEPHPAEDKSKTHGINGTRPTLHLCVDDVDERYRALAGIALFAPERTHWGTRWFVARDPDGNLIAFEQKEGAQAPVPLEAINATVARMEARLSASSELWGVYQSLKPRFERDLTASARDIALAKSAALMVLQGVQQWKS